MHNQRIPKTVVQPKNIDAFRIWIGKLGYTVKDLPHGGFNFRFKRYQYGFVTRTMQGNNLAIRLGEEFEEHLRA